MVEHRRDQNKGSKTQWKVKNLATKMLVLHENTNIWRETPFKMYCCSEDKEGGNGGDGPNTLQTAEQQGRLSIEVTLQIGQGGGGVKIVFVQALGRK